MIDKIIAFIKQLWVTPLVQEILLVAITAFVTHFLDSRKQKNEQKRKYLETVGSRISDALVCARELCEKTRIIDVFTEDGEIHTEDVKDVDAMQGYPVYPEFMDDQEMLIAFVGEVSEARFKHEPYLDLVSASYLYVLEKYLFDLLVYVKNNDLYNNLPFLGCAIFFDIQRWQRSFDAHLVVQINQPHYKLFSRRGRSWKKVKEKAEKKFLYGTELQKLMLGTSQFPMALVLNKISAKVE